MSKEYFHTNFIHAYIMSCFWQIRSTSPMT
nr:MAG TPA: hypothetical protein [Caudoviricetes sp.]